MKNKNQYLWFLSGIFGCCVNAFLYGETGNSLAAVGAIISFASYSSGILLIYRQRTLQRMFPK